MKSAMHGLSIGIERVESEFIMCVKAVGKLTHRDYESIIPMIDAVLTGVHSAHVKVLVDATKLEGWELRAAWDDMKLGLKHGAKFERIAMVSDSRWLEAAAKVGAWFVGGEFRVFTEKGVGADAALEWLARA